MAIKSCSAKCALKNNQNGKCTRAQKRNRKKFILQRGVLSLYQTKDHSNLKKTHRYRPVQSL